MKQLKLIRVTSVLSWIESAWKEYWFRKVGFEAADKITKESAEFGTRVHKLVEGVLTGETTIHGNSPEDQCASEILMYLGTNNITPMFTTYDKSLEIELIDETLGLIGHFDYAAFVKGKRTIIDFKTSKQMRKSFPLQKAAYAKMLSDKMNVKIDDGMTIRSHWNEEKQEVDFEVKEYTNLLTKYWPLFSNCLKIWKYFNRTEK